MSEKKRTPANKSKPKRTTKKKSPNSKKVSVKQRLSILKSRILQTLWSLFWKGGLAVCCAVAMYVVYLDAKVSKQFEGNKWQLPVQVYARAMTFYPDQYLSEQEVIWELERLNYSRVNRINRTGQYIVQGRTITVFRRAFEFYEGAESSRVFTLNFAGKKLANIVDKGGRRIAGERLEPVQIARIGNETNQDREFVPLEKFPNVLKQALLVVEDRNFYEHHGVSVWSIMRALYSNIRAGRTVQGGSTLTQQLAKNFYLTRERSLVRKVNEAFIALILDYRYSKDEILEAYLNEVYLGQAYNQGVHGMGLASEFYFAKPVDELEFDQVALLVAMVKGPSFYNPRRYPERTMERRDLVLRLMAENGIITTTEYRQSLERKIDIQPLKESLLQSYPGYLELVNRELKDLVPNEDVIHAGVRIFTYFELQKQSAMEEAITSGLPYLERRFDISGLEVAMVSVNTEKAGVSALVSGRQMRFSGFNRVLDTKRSVGSLVKPAIYLTALQQDFTLGTLLDDSPLQVTDSSGKTWSPENFDHKFRGPVPLYEAFSKSLNIPAVNLGLDVGVHKVANTMSELGVKSDIPTYPSMLLGAVELSSFDVAQMYTTLAANGKYSELTSISAITNASGKTLYKHQPKRENRFDPASVYMTKYGLKRVTKSGTGKRLNKHFPSVQLAGKTGTSNNMRDSWFTGFDHNTVTVAWVGRDDNKPTKLTGGTGALELYIRYLKPLNPQAIADERPAGVKWAFVNKKTGEQAAPHCGPTIQLPLRAELFNPKPSCQ
ncbi:penicillin-binding protein 1B [Pseudoalteromonas luteoviolacea]|uniref:Penicillin-binding protein 1B n=1 Tax=Pseudoalteromonas luteoviolacea H33 TaxID=1365251 RepID=A0A167FMJ3_9GAMM|nr:penicillin-binding protein 1B [Pseudoalteromonas luteoviolacea]KZN52518.1 peptidase [Pseudoalteromonas luteoviolacea H33]KZN76550.1 peptidase [Pseudoalteromonas luteoviolacea H33-S]MBQ4877045.1 penicillin-binding protein 1B [Pseudoalteromonas luteoviolacea]MBQ4905906.1 penicillin-binding protein 1B [Pseudoalteromonas luteoviolacea]